MTNDARPYLLPSLQLVYPQFARSYPLQQLRSP